MTQDFFECPDINMPMLVQQRRGSMAKFVRCDVLRKASNLNRIFYDDLNSSCS